MSISPRPRPPLRVHLTNVAGAGATQLLLSLLPEIERQGIADIEEIYLPDRGLLSDYRKAESTGRATRYRRRLPNVLSRFFECFLFVDRKKTSPLLVLGDLPLRGRAPQTLFVQSPHLCCPDRWRMGWSDLKFLISRLLFAINLDQVRAVIVQTPVMRDGLVRSYPPLAGRVHIVGQPVPQWLQAAPRRAGPAAGLGRGRQLRLIYPAAGYPHKNHRLLASIPADGLDWPVESLRLTIDPKRNPAPHVPWVRCLGFLPSADIMAEYASADGLLFLSLAESYGFPLLEAMFLGLPVVCPDLPYARTLCGDGAIYFDPVDVRSLAQAVGELDRRLRDGWWPDWSAQLGPVPESWAAVARTMVGIACEAPGPSLGVRTKAGGRAVQ